MTHTAVGALSCSTVRTSLAALSPRAAPLQLHAQAIAPCTAPALKSLAYLPANGSPAHGSVNVNVPQAVLRWVGLK